MNKKISTENFKDFKIDLKCNIYDNCSKNKLALKCLQLCVEVSIKGSNSKESVRKIKTHFKTSTKFYCQNISICYSATNVKLL